MLKKRIAAAVCAACIAAFCTLPCAAAYDTSSAAEITAEKGTIGMKKITIDGSTANTAENSVWRGFGFISANNSSRLLLDYKYEQPEEYDRLLKLMFDPEGPLKMSHLKIEMGADINSSSGTEPSTMRAVDEKADVTRGAGFQLAADVKKINPDVTLELLSWGLPAFVNNEKDFDKKRELRYKWFKETLDSAYETYGLEFDYIDPNFNERAVDGGWIKFFAERLKSESDTPYDYGKIKIVIADEDAAYNAGGMMLRDDELMDAVDIIGIHYTSTTDENTQKCKTEHGKEIWYSEGLSPAAVEKYAVNANGSGLGGVNSMLDVAGRIVNMYPNGGFTMYEFQPAIAAYYSGANYFPKQLITANEPWSGYTEIGAGIYMAEHFSLFSKPGWQVVDSAAYGDGREEAHVLYDTTDNYLTLTDPETGDYSSIFVNNTDKERVYEIEVYGLKKSDSEVQIWETRGPDEGDPYDNNYMRNVMSATPEQRDGKAVYTLTVKPYSMVTVTTLDVVPRTMEKSNEQTRLTLPYTDDFEYADYSDDYLASRGGAPRYTTDIGGAFEVVDDEERGKVIEQKITNALRGKEWGATPVPVTTLGDDSWANYTAAVSVKLGEPDEDLPAEENFAGIGARYINSSARKSRSGYSFFLYADGKWELRHLDEVIESGEADAFDPSAWHDISVTTFGDILSATIDGVSAASVTLSGEVTFSGRAALYSAYANNRFDDLSILPTDSTNYVNRLDELDSSVKYSGEWVHNTMDSFTAHNRTTSQTENGSFELSFEGDSLALIGKASGNITVELDGKVISNNEEVKGGTDKAAFWHKYSLGYAEHTVKVTVNSGSITLDAIEYGSDSVNKDGSGGRMEKAIEPMKAEKKIKNSNGLKAAAIAVGAAAVAAGVLVAVKKHKKK